VAGFVATGQLGIFTNGYWGHPAMKLPPEVNLLAVAHYLQALDFQRKANQVVAILGSKTPNIQNLAVGGVANAINLDSSSTLNMEKLFHIKTLLDEVKTFIEQVYLPDVAAIATFYPDWFGYGAGVTNYLAVPDLPLDTKGEKFDLPGGTIFQSDLKGMKPITKFGDAYFRDNVTEGTAHSWYKGETELHPWKGETVPEVGEWKEDGKYSWVKSPRFGGKPMQVGPTAAVLVAVAAGHEPTIRWTTKLIETAGAVFKVKGEKVPALGPKILESTLGRHAARAIRCAVMAETALKHWGMLVENIGKGDTAIFNKPTFPQGEQQGFGFHEAPRGVLSHWVVIRDGKIANYQAVVPSTWNAGPRDKDGQMGPYEASLVGNPMANPELPLEALRTIHSFDPCLACAVHTVDASGNPIAQVKVVGS
jgi:hydrogenase large subunit